MITWNDLLKMGFRVAFGALPLKLQYNTTGWVIEQAMDADSPYSDAARSVIYFPTAEV